MEDPYEEVQLRIVSAQHNNCPTAPVSLAEAVDKKYSLIQLLGIVECLETRTRAGQRLAAIAEAIGRHRLEQGRFRP